MKRTISRHRFSTSITDNNPLNTPTKIVSVTRQPSGLSSSFNYSFVPFSITVLQLTL
jgi:hypothetical protein